MDTVSIDSRTLYSQLGSPRSPLVLDVRRDKAFDDDDRLVAASLGLSRSFAKDHEMLEHAMPVYDSLYAWCRSECAGDKERHSWNASS
jgi:hypothetical protein